MANLKAFSQARAKREDEEIARLEAEQQEEIEIQEVENTPAPEDPAEANWAKRYADHRRLLQKKENDWKAREAELLAQVEQARSSQPNAVPVTQEELEDYINEYPKVGALINKIVENQLKGRMAGSEKDLADLKKDREELKEERAKSALAKRVPEFFGTDGLLEDGSKAIVERQEFHDWAMATENDPEDGWIFEAVYQSLNVGQAAAAINLWKSENNFSVESKKSKRKTKAKSDADAASSVRTTGKPTISESGKGDYDYSDSSVQRMSDAEYIQHEEAIEKAQREGRYLYDLSA